MDTETNTLGSLWWQSLPSSDPAHSSNTALFYAEQRRLDFNAEQAVVSLKTIVIPQGVQSCIDRGSDSLTIAIDSFIVSTEAFRALLDWLNAQGLTSAVILSPSAAGVGDDQVPLTITCGPPLKTGARPLIEPE